MTEPGALARSEQQVADEYRAYVERAYREHFGVRDIAQSERVAEDWFRIDDRHNGRFAVLRQRLPQARRVLDLASGLGTAALHGLSRGFDGYGIEPDAEKLSLMRRRIVAGALPADWASRFARAVGERLPYRDRTFDAILSHQTLEHVQDVDAVLAEMLRVVKPGGALHLRCPDYRGTFEGHYLLPWLPLMPRRLARIYLRLRGRPAVGLADIGYVTKPVVIRALNSAAGRAGLKITIIDLEHERIGARLLERGVPRTRLTVRFMGAALYLRRLFREATELNLWVSVG